MKKKLIKLKEGDLVKIVQKIIAEQIASTKPHVDDTLIAGANENPLASIKPTEKKLRKPFINKTPTINGDIVNKKVVVRSSLEKVLVYLGDLIQASGINPETNNLVADIQKVQDKFENLFGDPAIEDDGENIE